LGDLKLDSKSMIPIGVRLLRVVRSHDLSSDGSRIVKAAEMTSVVSTKDRMSFSLGQPVRICSGMLAGISGTLTELSSSERVSIQLREGVCLEIDQSCLELNSAE
jgi:hypothetical protein